jgi:hypothetical protein
VGSTLLVIQWIPAVLFVGIKKSSYESEDYHLLEYDAMQSGRLLLQVSKEPIASIFRVGTK